MRRLPVVDAPAPAFTRRHLLAVWWSVTGVSEGSWPIDMPIDVKSWEPDRAVRFMMDSLAEKDRTDPPRSGSWVAIAERAIANLVFAFSVCILVSTTQPLVTANCSKSRGRTTGKAKSVGPGKTTPSR